MYEHSRNDAAEARFAMMDTVAEFGIGVVLFVLGYRGFMGKWPWEPRP